MLQTAIKRPDAPEPTQDAVGAPSTMRMLRAVSDTWRVERGVFAADELGWLAEEAERQADLRGRSDAGNLDLADLHRRSEPFRRLAEHPRLLSRAVEALHGPVAIARMHVRLALEAVPRVELAADEVAILVPLGCRQHVARGDVVVARASVTLPLALDRPAGIVFRADPATPLVAQGDDCLWPSPWVVAG